MTRRSLFEQLEARQMLTVSSAFASGALTISASSGVDQIVVSSDGTNVKINDSDPVGGPILASSVTSIVASGSVAGNLIDLRGVSLDFTASPAIVIHGGDSNTIYGSLDYSNTINGGDGNDTIFGGNAGDTIDGGEGNDTIFGGDASDTIDGGEGDDTLFGGEGDDLIDGGEGDDFLEGGGGDDTLDGAEGNDTYAYNPATPSQDFGKDKIIEGLSNDIDTLDFSAFADGISIDLESLSPSNLVASGKLVLDLSNAPGLENVIGSAFDDVIIGNSFDNHLEGRGGDDAIYGGAGDDLLESGANDNSVLGGDTLFGNDGDDTYLVSIGAIKTSLFDGLGNDHYIFDAGSTGEIHISNELDGTAGGLDTLDFQAVTSGIDLALNLFDTIQNVAASQNLDLFFSNAYGALEIETVIGTDFNDTIASNSLNNRLEGRGGDDTYVFSGTSSLGTNTIVELSNQGIDKLDFSELDYGIGIDVNLSSGSTRFQVADTGTSLLYLDLSRAFGQIENVDGTSYGDQLVGNLADNTLDGKAGNDALIGFEGADQLIGGSGDDQLFGGGGNDSLLGDAGKDTLFGGDGNDVLDGGADEDALHGENDDDQLFGDDGHDLLDGGDGNDYLWGGTGDDELLGRSGQDYLYGEAGNDILDGGIHGDGQINLLDGGDDDDAFLISNTVATAGINQLNILLDTTGVDTIDFSGWSGGVGITIDLGTSGPVQYLDSGNMAGILIGSGTSLENVLGSDFDDVIKGNGQANTLRGRGGNDQISSAGGDNSLYGGEGNDFLYAGTYSGSVFVEGAGTNTLYGELGDDHLYAGSKTNYLYGNEGNDTYFVGVSLETDDGLVQDNFFEGQGDDTYVFGTGHLGDVAILPESLGMPDGNDTLDFSAMDAAISSLVLPDEDSPVQLVNDNLTLTLAGSTYESGIHRGNVDIETVVGTAYDDSIQGNLADNRLEGGAGVDTLESGGGSDILLGQADFDPLEAVDDQDGSNFVNTGTAWQPATFAGGFNQGQQFVASDATAGLQSSTWTFSNLDNGEYEVFITWEPNPNDLIAGNIPTGASNANAKVSADGILVSSFTLDQTKLPQGSQFVDRNWQQLGSPFSVGASGTLDIELSNVSSDGIVYADAVRIVKYNHAPVLSFIGDLSVAANADLDVAISANDQDGSNGDLGFSLVGNVPSGLTILNNGPGTAQIQWPEAGRPEGVFTVTIAVTDQGDPSKSSYETIQLTLGSTNTPPSITGISNLTLPAGGTNPSTYVFSIDELTTLEFDLDAVDSDNLTYSLAPGTPADASISGSGHFSWTPAENQDSGVPYEITIRVTDDGNPPIRVSQTIQVTVNEVNADPIITSLALLNDTGSDDTDGLTIDPTLTGTVVNDGSVANVEILVDYGNDTFFEATASVVASDTDPSTGTFLLEPSSLSFPVDALGDPQPLIVTVKAREWDPALGTSGGFQESAPFSITITPDLSANTLPVLSVGLLNNVGTVGAPESVDATILGAVVNADGPVNGLKVKIYSVDPITNSAASFVTETTDENGVFQHTSDGLVALDNDSDGRVSVTRWFIAEEKTAFGTFAAAPVQYSYTFLVNQAPQISSLQLLNDTGENTSDGKTRDLTIVGSITHSDGPLEGITIEFDDDNNGSIDGVTVTDALGNFTYYPTNSVDAPTIGSLDARAVEWDNYQNVLLVSPWLDDAASTHLNPLTLSFDETENAPPRVLSLQPLYPPAILNDPLADPTVWGMISNDNGLEGVAIEFSLSDTGQFGDVAGLSVTDENGRFEFTPAGLVAGTSYTLYARAIEWDDTLLIGSDPLRDQLLFDAASVKSTQLTLSETPLAVDSFSGVQLVFDTGSGADADNDETSDPTLEGTVVYDGDYSQIVVEFDHDGDGIIDGSVVPDENGNFQYTPEGFTDGQSITLSAQVRVPDFIYREAAFDDATFDSDDYLNGYNAGAWDTEDLDGNGIADIVDAWFDDVFNDDKTAFEGNWYNSGFQRDWDSLFNDYESGWQPTSFTLDLSENDPASVSGVLLLNPASPDHDPTITGTVSNDGKVEGLTVEFFLNGSLVPDGSTVTDEAGDFQYVMQEHTTGTNAVVVRVYEETYGTDDTTFGDSGPFSVDINPNVQLTVDTLELKFGSPNGSGGLEAIDPTLVGSTSSIGSSSLLTVRFDYDGDGFPDAETSTDGLGRFEFTPEGLVPTITTPKTTTVKVQIVEEVKDAITGTRYRTLSDWTTLTWDVVDNDAPVITLFELQADTGDSGLGYEVLDRVTSDPALIGQVVNNNGAGQLTVEFDHDGDGLVDGTAVTDENGLFRYTPEGLAIGGWDIRARVQEYDPVAQVTLFDDSVSLDGWVHITADGNPASPAPFYGFTLVAAQKAIITQVNHSGSSYDPTITGTVSDPEGTKNLTVEFFLNDNGISQPATTPIGSTTVAADGTFEFTPIGLPFATSFSIVAQTKEWDYASDTELRSDWDASGSRVVIANFTYGSSINTRPNIFSFGKLNPTNLFDPTVEGKITFNEDYVTPQYVEVNVYINNIDDGSIEAIVPIEIDAPDPNNPENINYHFSYRPDISSSSDLVTVKVRAVGLDENGYVFGFEDSESFIYDLLLPSFTVDSEVQDENSSSPTISGTILTSTTTYGSPAQEPIIEFDLDGDGVVDESVSAEDDGSGNYSFTHTFSNLPPGAVSIQARAIRFETVTESTGTSSEDIERTETITGDWQSIDFTLTDPAPRIQGGSLILVNEVGGSSGESTDPTIEGIVESDGTSDLFALTVEIDHDGDGIADGTAVTDESGNFEYVPQDLQPGDVTLQVRAIDPYTSSQQLVGDWTTINFELLAVPAPTVNSLELLLDEDAGPDVVSSDPTLVGTVTRHETVSLLAVEFDHDGDGLVDGSVTADYLGNFSYDPVDLSYGTNFITARGVAQSGTGVQIGSWNTAYEFFHASTEPPLVADLSAQDLTTGEISGRVTVDGFGARATVEIAVVNLGVRSTNGFATTDANGFFTYIPKDLTSGAIDLDIRGLLSHPSSTTLIEGDWQSLTSFNYSPDPLPTLPLVISNFRLAHDTGSSAYDDQTSDVTLVGEIDFSSSLVSIEFSHDGGASVAATVDVAADGSFEYQPEGLANLTNLTVHARYRLWDPLTGTETWYDTNWSVTTAVNFTFDLSQNNSASVAFLQLENSQRLTNGDYVGPTPVFTGTVTNDGKVGGLLVQFDHDGDGDFEGSAVTQADGSFIYQAQGLVPSLTPQSLTAYVTEQDYFGQDILSETGMPITFILLDVPLVSQLDYAPTEGLNNQGQIQGTVQTSADPTTTQIEFQLFGNYANALTAPENIEDYVPSSVLDTATVDNLGNFNIDLDTFALGLGPASIVTRVVDAGGLTGPWKTLSFVVQQSTVAALDLSKFELQEDTGGGVGEDTDGTTNNSTVEGTVGTAGSGAYAVVEFTISDGDPANDVVRRTTADSQGNFVFTPDDLIVSQLYTIDARHVVYDPSVQQEIFGTASPLSLTLTNSNGLATILGFGLLDDQQGSNLVDPTVKGTVSNDGRKAGLRIEFNTDPNSETVDGFTFTDADGNFEWTPYNLVAGATTIRARVVEWNRVTEQFTAPLFADPESSSTTFTLTQAGPSDPTLDENFAADQDAIEHAETGAKDAIFSFLGSLAGATGSSSDAIDIGIGSIKILHLSDSDTLDDAISVGTIFDFNDDVLPNEAFVTNTAVPITAFTTADGGVLNGTYDYERIIIDLGNNSFSIHVKYVLDFTNYTNSLLFTESSTDINSSTSVSLGLEGIYSFQYDATIFYTESNGIEITGSHDIAESLDYDFLRTDDEIYTDTSASAAGANDTHSTAPGDNAYFYAENGSTFGGGTTTQSFSFTTTNRTETWIDDSGSSDSGGTTRNWSEQGHSLYVETIVNSGTIVNTAAGQTITGVITIDASGSSTYDRDENTTYVNTFGNGSESGSSSRTETSQYIASYNATTNYTLGQSSSTDFSFSDSSNGTLSVSGTGSSNSSSTSGPYSNSESWNYGVSSSINSSTSASGAITTTYSGSDSLRSFSVSIVEDGSFSSSGNSNGLASYTNATGSGTSSGNASFGSSSSFSASTALSGTDDDVFVTASGSLQYDGNYSNTSTGSGNSSSAGESRNFSSVSVASSDASGSTTYRSSKSNDQSTTSGSFGSFTSGSLLTASQVVGTRDVPDGQGLGGTVSVPFRGNTTSSSSIDVDNSGVFSSSQKLTGSSNESDSQTTGIVTRKTNGSSRSSSYTGIAGEFTGHSLTKSQGSSNDSTAVLYLVDDGNAQNTGVFSRSSGGSSDSVTVLASSNVSGDTTTTSNSRSSTGSNSMETSQGVFSVDSTGRKQAGTSFSSGKGFSTSTGKTTRTTDAADSFSFSTGTTNTKGKTNATGQGPFQIENGALLNQTTNSQSDSKSRVKTSGNSLNYSSDTTSIPYGATTSTFTIDGSGGRSRANNNNRGTDTTRREDEDITRDGTANSDYGGNQRGNGFRKTHLSVRDGDLVEYTNTTSSGKSNGSTTGGGSGTTHHDADSNDYNYPVHSTNSGGTSGRTVVSSGRRDSASNSHNTVTRTDSGSGSSSYDGTVSRTGDQYSRSGDVTRTTTGSADIKSTSGSNYTSSGGLTFHWTVSTSDVGASQDFSLDGNSTNTNDSSVLAGDVTTSNTTTVGGSDTVGQRTANNASNTTGYNQVETTVGSSSSLTKTLSGSVSITNGITKTANGSLTSTTENTASVKNVVESRSTNTNPSTGEVTTLRYDRTTKRSLTLTDEVPESGDPTHTEKRALEEDITDFSESTFDWTLSGSNGSKDYTRKITDETIIDQDDTTTYTLNGDQESLTINNDKTVDRNRKVTDGQFVISTPTYSYSSVGNSTLKDKTVSTAFYESSHTLSDSGEVTDGKLTSNSEVTTDYSKWGSSDTLPIPDSPPPSSSYSESNEFFYNTLHATSKSDEKGTYRDFLGFRLSFGTYTDEFSSSSTGISLVTSKTEDIDSSGFAERTEEKDLNANSNSHERKIKGAYSPIGGTEEVEKDHRKTSTLVATTTTRPKDYVDPLFYNINVEHSERTDTDVSLDKATGTLSVRDFIVSYIPYTEESIPQSTNGTVVTDLYANTDPPMNPGKVDTGGSGGGVFAFDPNFSDEEFISFNDSLSDEERGDLYDSLSRAEQKAYSARAVGLNNARGGSISGGQTDQFSTAGAFAGRLAFEAADLVADEIPYFGQGKGIAELISGKNALGEDLGVIGRIGAGLNSIPGGGIAKRLIDGAAGAASGTKKLLGALVGFGKKADDVVDGAARMGKTATKTAKAVGEVPSKRVRETLQSLPKGKQGHVRTVPNEKALDDLFDSLTAGAKTLDPGTYPGIVRQLPDGTIIRKRPGSKSGGSTIDITFLDGLIGKIHIE